MSNTGRSFLVIGAGIGGLAAATALARRGADVTVLERAPEVTEVGAGLQISPNGSAVLAALGVDTLAGRRLKGVELRDAVAGGSVARLDIDAAGYAHDYKAWHRADLIAALEAAATRSGVQVRTGAEVDTIDMTPDGCRVRLADGGTCDALAVVGAFGVRSPLRQRLVPGPEPEFSGHVAWRATIPLAADTPDLARVWMAPGRHLVSYPLRTRGLLNLVAVRETQGWAAEGWNHEDDPDTLRAAFADCGGPVLDLLDQVTRCNLWGLFRHPVPNRWHDGLAVMLGDAVHPTLPFMAQGASMALEDAWHLAEISDRDASLERAFATFTQLRLARTRRIVAAANMNARLYHLARPQRGPAHLALKLGNALLPGAALKRFDWLYRYDPTKA